MNIYLDESYNLQRKRGKMFISINGFAVLDEKILRKKWKNIRKPYTKLRRRIHATDSRFEGLRKESIKLLGRHDVNILSVFQLQQEIDYKYFKKNGGMNFDVVYEDILKSLLGELSLGEYRQVKIIVDSRKHKGGRLAKDTFRKNIEVFFRKKFPDTKCIFKLTPSCMDILVELADIISNTFYKEYQKDSEHVFESLGFRFTQIKNPL